MPTVGEYICAHLKDNGVNDVFGVAGDFVLSFLDAVLRDGSLRLISCTNELNASYAADGYSRASRYACLSVTFGCGELSAANGIGGANAEGIPLLMVVGRPPSDTERIHHQASPDNVISSCMAMQSICAQSLILTPNNLAELPPFLKRAPLACGPSYLSVPCSLFDYPFVITPPRASVPPSVTPMYLASGTALNNLIQTGKRPLIIIGQELNILSRSPMGRYIVPWLQWPKHATICHALGSAGLFHTEGWRSISDHVGDIQEFAPVIHLGWTHHDLTSGFGAIPIGQHEVSGNRITVYEGKPSLGVALRILENAIALAGDKGAFTEKLPDVFSEPPQSPHFEIDDEAAPLNLKGLTNILSQLIVTGDKLVRDTGRVTFDIGTMSLPAYVPIFHQEMYASIGWSGGACLGVHLRKTPWDNGRTISVIGDGAFHMVHNEIANIVRLNLPHPLIYIVANNDGYLVERTIKDGEYNDIPMIDYAGLARAMHVRTSAKASTEGELVTALKQCIGGGVHFIEVVLPKFDMLEPEKAIRMGDTIWKRNSYVPTI